MDEWVVSQYQHQDDLKNHRVGITIDMSTSPFYEGNRWAVRFLDRCLSVKGRWEYEPLPSSRSQVFYHKFRFTSLEAAKAAASKAREGL